MICLINQFDILVSPAEKSFAAVVEQVPGSFLCTAQSSDEDHLSNDSSVGTSSVTRYCDRFGFSVAWTPTYYFLTC